MKISDPEGRSRLQTMNTEPEDSDQAEEPHANATATAAKPAPAPPEEPGDDGAPAAEEIPAAPPVDDNKKWYVVKVQSGREESIKDAIERRVKIEGLQESFGQILIPTEKVTELNRNNKRVVKERKLFPGYIMVNLEFNDRMLFLFRETSGVGDFVGGSFNKPPPPMTPKEVERLEKSQLAPEEREQAPGKDPFEKDDHVKV